MSLLLVLIVSLVVFVLVGIVVVWRYRAAIRRLEAACGLIAALVGCLVLAYALFVLLYQFESSSGQSGTANMLQVGIPPSALLLLGLLLLGLTGVAVSAVLHSNTGGSGWRLVLWVATTLIVIMTFVTIWSIGLLLLPSTLFALLASALSLGPRRAALG